MKNLWSRRFTIVFIDRTSGVGRRVTVPLGWTLTLAALAFMLPVLIGLGMRLGTVAEIASLQANAAGLSIENASYKAATGELATQVVSLQGVIDELASRAKLDPAAARAMQKLPAVVKDRAMGGAALASPPSVVAAPLTSPEDTFGVIRDVLGRLELGLRVVRTDVERREALAAATPSLWPTIGWLSAGFGGRADPINGAPAFHAGLDISTDTGTGVVAPADATVESTGWSGNYGNLLILDHGLGIKTRYGHLSSFAVKPGAWVKRGDIIGYVGATGRTTGPHLHYEILTNGQLINPLQLLAR